MIVIENNHDDSEITYSNNEGTNKHRAQRGHQFDKAEETDYAEEIADHVENVTGMNRQAQCRLQTDQNDDDQMSEGEYFEAASDDFSDSDEEQPDGRWS